MFSITASSSIFRQGPRSNPRSCFSSLGINWEISPKSVNKKRFSSSKCLIRTRVCALPNHPFTFRTIHTKCSVFNNEIPKRNSLGELNEVINDDESKWSFASKDNLFKENESIYYHNVLEHNSAYMGTVFKDDSKFSKKYALGDIEYQNIVNTTNWHEKSTHDIITSFISLGIYASKKTNLTIEDKHFDALISSLIKSLAQSTEDQLIDCFISLKYWPLSTSNLDPQILKVWKELDEVCFQRYMDWSIDKCLYMMDIWYHLGVRAFKKSFFVYKALCKISRKTDEFTAAQLIQSLFYMSFKRTLSPQIAIREYEHYIQKYITNLSIEEIGIFAAGFFKTKTPILNKKILIYLMQRTVEEIETIHAIPLASIAKVIRLSHKPDVGFTANDMVNKVIESRWDSLTLVTGIHIVHIGTQVQFFNEEALTKLSEMFCKNPSKARLKDLERLAFFLSLYNFVPPTVPDVVNIIAEQLDLPLREKEAEFHPLMFLSLLYFLSLLQVFPEKHIRKSLNEQHLLERYGNRFTIPQQTVQLDYNRVLEGPPGSEHLLSPQMREYLARRHSLFIPDGKYKLRSQFDQVLSEVMEVTNDLLGKENNFVTYTLPHFPRGDILFRLDDNGNPLPIPNEMKTNKSDFEDVHRPVGPGRWFCVVIGGRNMYMHNVPRLVGEQTTKLRQLRAIGYTPIVLPSYYWKKEEDKLAYLKLKYFSSHNK